MYNELYEAWRREKENHELQPLSKEFYERLADYISRMRKESRMLDEKTTKAKLLAHEAKNVQKMVKELILLRQEKTVKKAMTGAVVPVEGLTKEEEKLTKEVSPPFESFHSLLKDVLGGRVPQMDVKERPKRQILRFLKEIPAIMGADMKTYGPFKPEDIASVPQENAKILVKQGVAIEVEPKS